MRICYGDICTGQLLNDGGNGFRSNRVNLGKSLGLDCCNAGFRSSNLAGQLSLDSSAVAAAVILDPDAIPDGLNDSKKLTAAKREALFIQILATATVSIASSGSDHIDRRDIRKASLDAMRRAAAGLSLAPAHLLCDGRDVPPGLICGGTAVIKGDARSLSIAAASIVAKVMRDRMMTRAALVFPQYGFDAHAGYGTKVHQKAIADHGPCPLHRMSFSPLRLQDER
ncbi:ribonuclease HII [Agrobacterium vitis]|uniref:ribonuclease HII n=1 Tax=Rhizobium/Agrobacterium group TaxID=227290 RepID=UPI0012E8AFE6|nr:MULTISPECIES: ribonuclease HII [Rhizobium/Agrobacterium group]MCF1493949.1 ribonuclease HII [Allorhizobium ampelinum]MVA44290.1 ribonuclease HII [Agrobacterium vitis]